MNDIPISQRCKINEVTDGSFLFSIIIVGALNVITDFFIQALSAV
jgi:hypothetical protein